MSDRDQLPLIGEARSRVILDPVALRRALQRLTFEIIEQNHGVEDVALVGVRTRGVPLANRLQKLLQQQEGVEVPVGELDITLYRDDVFTGLATPEVGPTHLPFEVGDRQIVLVDDVLYTGRTVKAALDALMDWGRPRRIQLAVLVDRGHRELPVAADYTGLAVDTARDESIQVKLAEIDGTDEVLLHKWPERQEA
ncbi:MAG: bifunctional pyr operon transcriptional regulator/uracil phosphoribosyltransferase PyrR [Bradymonadia bacterium]